MTTRFSVTYRIRAASLVHATERARAVAIEQTVEIPREVIPAGFIADAVVGQVEAVDPAGEDVYHAVISYLDSVAGPDLPQFLNTVFGNSSLQDGVRVIAIAPPASLAAAVPGPRFGIDGLRRRLGQPDGGLIMSVLKPVGLSAAELADLAYRMALGGVDCIKDDHGIADQGFARFEERIDRCVAAIARANRETGGRTTFFANLLGPFDEIMRRAERARGAGVGGFMVIPGLMGLDATRALAAFDLPIISHPAFAGGHVAGRDSGFDHAVMLGFLQRLAGADAAIYPNTGGRFGFTPLDCLCINDACRRPAGWLKPIFPAPGGGISIDRLPDLKRLYGPDTLYLLGGSILRLGDAIVPELRRLKAELSAR